MWYLNEFDKSTDQLHSDTKLPMFTLEVARSLWGGSDAELYGSSLEVDGPRATRLKDYLEHWQLDFDRFVYQIQYYTD